MRNRKTLLLVCLLFVSIVAFFALDFTTEPMASSVPANQVSENAMAELDWPPRLDQSFPDNFEYYDQTGEVVKMSDFKGKILLIEYVGMNCPACQAFSGANNEEIGAFENNKVQKGVWSIEKLVDVYSGGLKLSDDRIYYIGILLYDMKMGAPSARDARKWAKHFKLYKSDNKFVLAPTQDLRNSASYNLIPGVHVVDRNFIVRGDSAGHSPKQSLTRTVLPIISRLVTE